MLPWAFAIARRLSIDEARRERRAPVHELDAGGLAEPWSDGAGQDELLAASEMASLLQAAFDRLPESQRTAFNLVKREGLTFAQAAEVLGTTIPAVKLRAQRALDGLRIVLADESKRAAPESMR